MTIDEIIREGNEEIAKRLKRVKATKSSDITIIHGKDELELHDKAIRNKAIDDFAEKAIKIVYEANNRDRNPQPRDIVADIHYKLLEIAERLKAGGENV